MGFLNLLRAGLAKTRGLLAGAAGWLGLGRPIDEALLSGLEERLVVADVGPRLAAALVEDIRQRWRRREIAQASDILAFLKAELARGLAPDGDRRLAANPDGGPSVVLVVGVNGAGKTTTTAKLALHLQGQGHQVLLAAADTFRAAAGEQLGKWADRVGVGLVRHPDGADPAAVVYDACGAAVARRAGYLLVDTAGRLHNKAHLMQQLEKIRRVAAKKIPGAPHETLLVLDATTGQNALSQARIFAGDLGVTGLVLAKLDGTAKGGVAIAINREVNLPIKYVGLGEKETDLAPFDPAEFVEALFGEEGGGAEA